MCTANFPHYFLSENVITGIIPLTIVFQNPKSGKLDHGGKFNCPRKLTMSDVYFFIIT